MTQDFHHSPLLEKVFTDAIDKLSGKVKDDNVEEPYNGEELIADSDDSEGSAEKSKTDEIAIERVNGKIDSKLKATKNRPPCNYIQVFGTDDELLKLVLHEGKFPGSFLFLLSPLLLHLIKKGHHFDSCLFYRMCVRKFR